MASEGLKYEQVMGQNADLSDLQRILLRSKTKLSNNQQQNITRWAVAGFRLQTHICRLVWSVLHLRWLVTSLIPSERLAWHGVT